MLGAECFINTRSSYCLYLHILACVVWLQTLFFFFFFFFLLLLMLFFSKVNKSRLDFHFSDHFIPFTFTEKNGFFLAKRKTGQE